MKYARMAALILGAALGLGTLAIDAQAQDRDDYRRGSSPQIVLTQYGWGSDNASYDHGYRDGSNAGRQDADKGKPFIAYEHGSYRDSHNSSYRDGYLQGYRAAYGRNSRGGWYNGGYRNDVWRDRDGYWHHRNRDRDERWHRDHDRDDDNRWRNRDHDHDRDDRWHDRDHDQDRHRS